jgi:hypothetical protein
MFRWIAHLAATTALLLPCASVAQAFMGNCLLEVDHQVYLDGPCNIEMEGEGSFTIGVGEAEGSKYFAYVNLDSDASGVAVGYWNGAQAESHAHEELGNLFRHGGCWINDRAKVRAWRFGTRPR